MRLNEVTSGFSFKTSLWIICCLLPLIFLSSWALVVSIGSSLEDELKAQIIEESLLYEQIYKTEGKVGLSKVIREVDRNLVKSQRAVALFSKEGINILGNNHFSILPEMIGWLHVKEKETKTQISHQDGHYIIQIKKFDDVSILVGRSLKVVQNVQARLIINLIIFSTLLALIILVIGYFLSKRSYVKLKEIEEGLRLVSEGNLDARLPISDNNDQIDRVSKELNKNLDRMQSLIEGIKSTSIAIAHDLKTPLSRTQLSLHSALDMLEKEMNPEQCIQNALDETVELNRLFETMLRISRIQTQRKDRKKFKHFLIEENIHNVIEFLESLANENNQKLLLQLDPGLQALGDEGMIQQVIYNLISNAIQHSGEETQIIIRAKETPTEIEISVQDNGLGISNSELDGALVPFSRGDSARTSEGNGLGLSLISAIVAYHDGRLCLNNNDPGLSVSVHLPK